MRCITITRHESFAIFEPLARLNSMLWKTILLKNIGTPPPVDFRKNQVIGNIAVGVKNDEPEQGETLSFLKEQLKEKGAGKVLSCLLCKKDHPRPQAGVKIDYLGFTLPDKWLVGYGMDYNGEYRGLPHISHITNTYESWLPRGIPV